LDQTLQTQDLKQFLIIVLPNGM